MAEDPLSKVEDRTFRCTEEDFPFQGPVEYVRQRVEEPGGGSEYTAWVLNRPLDVNCPNDPLHRIELVEE